MHNTSRRSQAAKEDASTFLARPQPAMAPREAIASAALESRTKEERIADLLREAILSGRLRRGARLKQVEIAGMLRTSITPVRGALRILEAEGYVESGSYRGATVSPFDEGASAEVLSLRMLLEGELVRAANAKLTAADLSELRALSKEFEEGMRRADSEAARGANYRLHRRLYDVAGLPQTLHLVQILWARYPFDVIHRITGRTRRAAEEHEAILERMAAGDVEGAVAATRRHIETGWAEFHHDAGESRAGAR
jgi:DNA-binding GntR family transcriptional regulator